MDFFSLDTRSESFNGSLSTDRGKPSSELRAEERAWSKRGFSGQKVPEKRPEI